MPSPSVISEEEGTEEPHTTELPEQELNIGSTVTDDKEVDSQEDGESAVEKPISQEGDEDTPGAKEDEIPDDTVEEVNDAKEEEIDQYPPTDEPQEDKGDITEEEEFVEEVTDQEEPDVEEDDDEAQTTSEEELKEFSLVDEGQSNRAGDVTSEGTCGGGYRGNGVCPAAGTCCSKFGK
jgi:hypothetical protein